MPTEITQEMVNTLRSVLTIKQIDGKIVTVFADDVSENVIDRLQTYDMIKDEFTRTDMYEFLNHFARLLELDLGTYTTKDLDCVFHSIYDDEEACGDVKYLSEWLAADPDTREDYVNEAITDLIPEDDSEAYEMLSLEKILLEAKTKEMLAVYDLGYNFMKWYLDIEEDEEE